MKLIKHNETRMLFQESNSHGDQVLTIKDYDGDVVTIQINYEGEWMGDAQLDEYLEKSVSMPVILIKPLKGGSNE